MRWKRRKPLWPLVVALGSLLVLALVAPQMWQRLATRQLSPAEQPNPVATAEVALPALALAHAPTIHRETLPTRREFDLDNLLRVCDQLIGILEQPPADAAPRVPALPPARVRVANENDRLAMLPPRLKSNPTYSASISGEEIDKAEEENFASILLDASRKPRKVNAIRVAEPRLAMRPPAPVVAKEDTKIVAAPTVPEIAVPAPKAIAPEIITPETIAPNETAIVAPLPPSPPAIQHRPLELIQQLQEFDAEAPGALWAQQVLGTLTNLTEEAVAAPLDATAALDQLERLYLDGLEAATERDEPSYSNHWQQAAQSLGRRLVLWRMLIDPEQPKIIGDTPATTTLLPVLRDTAQLLDTHQNGLEWREYLLLDRLAEMTSQGIDSPTLARSKLAQEVLSRMEDSRLTDAQREFLLAEPMIDLHHALLPWAAGMVNLETLAALLERYESGREYRYAVVIAQLGQRLQWSDDPRLRELAAHLEEHYRGANLRIAISNDLFNRMLPMQEPTITPVRDSIAGAKVRGRARTTTQLQIRLMPDNDAWHFGLEAFGKIYSDTRSDTWPARVRNAAKMQYQAQKDISINSQGVHVAPTKASAQGRNELIGVDSQLDPVPIVGFVLRDLARQKHRRSRPQALSEAKAKVVRQVKQRMDTGLDEKLDTLEQNFRDKVLTPIEELALLAEPLDMHTTDERAVMQLRLANSGQLAAHTLRPLAPSDSVLSLQMHETALNNAMMGLGLDGRRMTMLELFDFLAERFGRAGATPPEDLPSGAIVKFAARDSVRVLCDGDRLELVMSVAELSHRRDKIRNFQIHVHFRPVLEGLDVRLVREGTLQFSGRRLKTGPRVVLHSVLGKLLVNEQEIKLLGGKVLEDPRLQGLMVTQMVIEDGWIGLALGPSHPHRTAARAETPKLLNKPFVRY